MSETDKNSRYYAEMKRKKNPEFMKLLTSGALKIVNDKFIMLNNPQIYINKGAAIQEKAIKDGDPLGENENAAEAVASESETPLSAGGGALLSDTPSCMVSELIIQLAPNGAMINGKPGSPEITGGTAALLQSTGAGAADPSKRPPPYISFITFNRLGLTIKNMEQLLDSEEDFELNIIDCNSKDNSWDYILSLTDSRIKSKIRLDKNLGPIFAVNLAMTRRKPDQYFIAMDSDTHIKTKNWIARFMEVFDAFPEVGMLGLMRDNPYPRYMPPIIPKVKGNVSYLELKNADINSQMDFIPGQLQCLRPELIREIGYWSEENGFGDAELSPRIVHYTGFKVGFVVTIEIDMTQKIPCSECKGKGICKLSRSVCDCFSFSRVLNKNESFVAKNTWKFKQSFEELKEGKRTAYCASMLDPESMKNHYYAFDWAYENFNHYLINSN
jgi:cellulose synthase/poly-beta-1,6-N-acetylglucosamine synthase-like glycosyltransferase